MRNHSLSTIVSNPVMAQRSSSGSHQLLIADDYDFDRVRSTESTENALTIGKVSNGGLPTTLQASPSFDDEDRGVPITPKKLPMTPPRDHGSPYRPNNHTEYLQQPIFGGIPEDSTSLTRQPFLRPAPTSTWRHKEEDTHGGASIFRSSYAYDDELSSRGHESFYTIQRSMAFDEDDDDMEVGGGYCCSS